MSMYLQEEARQAKARAIAEQMENRRQSLRAKPKEAPPPQVAKNTAFSLRDFNAQNDHFTKTGSGQTLT
jgi:hypothetical protein